MHADAAMMASTVSANEMSPEALESRVMLCDSGLPDVDECLLTEPPIMVTMLDEAVSRQVLISVVSRADLAECIKDGPRNWHVDHRMCAGRMVHAAATAGIFMPPCLLACVHAFVVDINQSGHLRMAFSRGRRPQTLIRRIQAFSSTLRIPLTITGGDGCLDC